ncbi:hypothetical protein CcaCcLH18_01425 [Colletotrichum camelliae]|nr:hypothetical protein CcaCcLH18_01425 [Colletotrichum camelliae]
MTDVEDAGEDPTNLVQSMLRSICKNMEVSCAREVIPEVHSPHVFTVEFLQPLYLICAFLDISPEGKQLGDTAITQLTCLVVWLGILAEAANLLAGQRLKIDEGENQVQSYEKQPRKQDRFELLFRKSHLWNVYYAMCGVSSPFDRLPGIQLWKSQQSHKTYRLEAFLVKQSGRKYELQMTCMRYGPARHVLEIEGLRTELQRKREAMEALLAENKRLQAEISHLRLEASVRRSENKQLLKLLEAAGVPAPSPRELSPLAAADDEILGVGVGEPTSDYEEDGLVTSSASDQDISLPDAAALVPTTKAKLKGWKGVMHTMQRRQRWREIEELLTQKDLADVESELRRLTRHLPLEFRVTRRRDTDHDFVTRLRHSLWVGKYVELYDTVDERMLPIAGALLARFKTVSKEARNRAFKACWNRHKVIHGILAGES